MPVTITDNRTIIDQADAVTNFNKGTLNTTDFAEATGAIALAVNIATDQLWFDASAAPLDFLVDGSELVYLWSANTATQNSWLASTTTTAPHGIHISDTTNTLVLLQSGGDRDVFKHADTQVLFQNFLIDIDFIPTKVTAGEVVVVSGSADALVTSAITQIGAHYTTNSKALGGGFNVFLDVLKFGNDGITIAGGASATVAGTFAEIAAADRSKADGAAHGLLREYTSQTYGCQGTLQFGNVSGSTYFNDADFVLAFEDRDVNNDKWKMVVFSSTGGFTSLILNDSTITSARPGVELDFSSSHIDVLTLNSVTFTGLLNTVTFAPDASAENQTVTDCTFNQCGQIDPGQVIFSGTTISNTTAASGAMLIDADGTTRLSALSFVAGSVTHAMKFTSASTYTLTSMAYSGYGPTGSTNATVFNDSGGLVTLNIAGGDTPSFRNGAGASTVVNAAFILTLTGIEADSEVRILDTSKEILDGTEQITGSVLGITINAAGSGYTAADVLTLAGGVGTSATLTVDTIGGAGEITGLSITTPGSYTSPPPDPNTPTGGTGDGAIIGNNVVGAFPFNFNFSPGDTVTIVVFHLNFRDIRIVNFPLTGADSSIPIQQQIDRVFSNP